jgi:hypothetical protein
MLRIPSRQALKALHNPFRNPLPNPLRIPLQMRHLHYEAAPFSGPPSYATLAQRFSSSSPGPIRFFLQKAAEEAIGRGEYVDVHDISGVDPKDYDVLITEIDHSTLHSEISKLVDIPYLKEATKDEADKVAKEIRGFFYGRTLRMIFPCVLTIKDQARWVFFIVVSGAPLTYISTEVSVHPHRKNASAAINLTLGSTSLRSSEGPRSSAKLECQNCRLRSPNSSLAATFTLFRDKPSWYGFLETERSSSSDFRFPSEDNIFHWRRWGA